MIHIKFESVDYATSITFGKNQNNRNFNHGQLQNIKKQWLQSTEVIPPITVNVVTNNIIDGQHRWRAFNELVEKGDLPDTSKIDVKYVSIPVELERDAIINANTNSKNWSLDDYISSYVKAGNKAYMMLDEWCKRHELTEANGKPKFRYGAAIITGKNCSNALKNGDFTFREYDLTKADIIHAEMLEIIDIFELHGKGGWIESLAVSWSKVREQHEVKTWMQFLNKRKKSFAKAPKSSQNDWDTIFSQIHMAIDLSK